MDALHHQNMEVPAKEVPPNPSIDTSHNRPQAVRRRDTADAAPSRLQQNETQREANRVIARRINEENMRDLVEEMFPHLDVRNNMLKDPFREERTASMYLYEDGAYDFGQGPGGKKLRPTEFLLTVPGSPFENDYVGMIKHFSARYDGLEPGELLHSAMSPHKDYSQPALLVSPELVVQASHQREGVAELIDHALYYAPDAQKAGYAYLESRGISQRVAEYSRVTPLVIEDRKALFAIRNDILEASHTHEGRQIVAAAGLLKSKRNPETGENELKPHFVWDDAALVIHPDRHGQPFHWTARRLDYEHLREQGTAEWNQKYFNAYSSDFSFEGEHYKGALKIGANQTVLERLNSCDTLYVVEGAIDAYAGAALGKPCFGIQGRVSGCSHGNPDGNRIIHSITEAGQRRGFGIGILPDADDSASLRNESQERAEGLKVHWTSKGIPTAIVTLDSVMGHTVTHGKDLADIAQIRYASW